MNEVEAVKSLEKSPDLGAAGDPVGLQPKMVTPLPTLRVDELRDEDGHSSSGKSTTTKCSAQQIDDTKLEGVLQENVHFRSRSN